MTSEDQRIAALMGRTSREAWRNLQRMRHHPRFGWVLTELEKIPGTIKRHHVESAAQQFIDEPEAQN